MQAPDTEAWRVLYLGLELIGWRPAYFELAVLVVLISTIVIAKLCHTISSRYILSLVDKFISRTKNTWDDTLQEMQVFKRLSLLPPALAVYVTAMVFFPADYFPTLNVVMINGAMIYLIIVGLKVLNALLTAVAEIYQARTDRSRISIRGFLQALRVTIFCLAAIWVIALIMGKSPFFLFSGLGALTAVLLLIFRDPILGLVASVVLSTNDMIRPGDWISVPKYDADGDVIDVTLTTVRIRNWNKSIAMVPNYALVSQGFTNWRGLDEAGGRRIKRAVFVDINSIRFADQALRERLCQTAYLQVYIAETEERLEAFRVDMRQPADSADVPRQTNIGLFRAYLNYYLKHHPAINQNMTLMVRQLAPGHRGLPIEVYAFSTDRRWDVYERLQADIFDHILALLPLFDLRVFQDPTGQDWRAGGVQPGQAASEWAL